MSEDKKACQEAFEKWSKESGMDYNMEEVGPIENCENHYCDGITYYVYHGWKAAWKNRTEALKEADLVVGDFELRSCPGMQTKIWIQREQGGGEGGTFDIKEFEAAIEAFFLERM